GRTSAQLRLMVQEMGGFVPGILEWIDRAGRIGGLGRHDAGQKKTAEHGALAAHGILEEMLDEGSEALLRGSEFIREEKDPLFSSRIGELGKPLGGAALQGGPDFLVLPLEPLAGRGEIPAQGESGPENLMAFRLLHVLEVFP